MFTVLRLRNPQEAESRTAEGTVRKHHDPAKSQGAGGFTAGCSGKGRKEERHTERLLDQLTKELCLSG